MKPSVRGSYPGSAAACETGTAPGRGQQGDYYSYSSSIARVEPQIINFELLFDILRLFQGLWVECNVYISSVDLSRYSYDRQARAAV